MSTNSSIRSEHSKEPQKMTGGCMDNGSGQVAQHYPDVTFSNEKKLFPQKTPFDSSFAKHYNDIPKSILLNGTSSYRREFNIKKHETEIYDCSNSVNNQKETSKAPRVSFRDEIGDVCLPVEYGKPAADFDYSALEKLDESSSGSPVFIGSLPSPHQSKIFENQESISSMNKDNIYGEKTKDFSNQVQELHITPFSNQNTETTVDGVILEHSTIKCEYGIGGQNNRFTFFNSQDCETINAPFIGALIDDKQTLEQLFTSSAGSWWLDCLDATDTEMRALSKAFGIHPLTTEDIMMKEPREKFELFKNYYFVSFQSFESNNLSEEFLDPINFYLVVFPEGIITFHFTPVEHTSQVRRRIRKLQNDIMISSDWICYALIDSITDSFQPILKDIEYETDFIEDSVFIATEEDFRPMLVRIGEARRKVMRLLRLMSGKADVVRMYSKRCDESFDKLPRPEISIYLGDIQDHIVTMHQNLTSSEKILSRSHANYLAQLQVESVNSNNRVTKVLGRVTVVGTILVPLNLITGLFGMNVYVPGQGEENFKWFFGIIGLIILIITFFSWLSYKWLGDAESDSNAQEYSLPARLISSSNPSTFNRPRIVRMSSRSSV